MKQLSFTQDQFATFKKRYKVALKLKDDSFWFEENEFLTLYAKYLIEYIESLEPQR